MRRASNPQVHARAARTPCTAPYSQLAESQRGGSPSATLMRTSLCRAGAGSDLGWRSIALRELIAATVGTTRVRPLSRSPSRRAQDPNGCAGLTLLLPVRLTGRHPTVMLRPQSETRLRSNRLLVAEAGRRPIGAGRAGVWIAQERIPIALTLVMAHASSAQEGRRLTRRGLTVVRCPSVIRFDVLCPLS
jgi:hypothetical protein